MTILMFDNKLRDLNLMMSAVRDIYRMADVFVFNEVDDLLLFAADKRIDVAFLLVNASTYRSIEAGIQLISKNPSVNIIFTTDDESMPYSSEAWKMRASGYIIKPIDAEKVQIEMLNLRHPVEEGVKLKVVCYGEFEVLTLQDKPVYFARKKEKELLAFLIHRKGATVIPREAASVIFEDVACTERTMRYFEKVATTLTHDLKAIGADSVIIRSYNRIAANLAAIDCDCYGNNESYSNREYMTQYKWAHIAENEA